MLLLAIVSMLYQCQHRSGHRITSRAKMRRVHLAAATQLINSRPSNDALIILVTFYRNFLTDAHGRCSAKTNAV